MTDKDARIDRLERERELMMMLLKYDDEQLDRALEIYEASKWTPVKCVKCGAETSVTMTRDSEGVGVVCGACRA